MCVQGFVIIVDDRFKVFKREEGDVFRELQVN